MPRYDWFRLHYEARTDKKLDCLSDAQHRVWFALLCLAAEQADGRGTIPPMADTLLAIEVARRDADTLRSTIEALIDLAILRREDDGGLTFINFQKRQYDKPSDTPSETARRKQEQRDRMRGDMASREVTPGHATYTEEIREEEKIDRGEEVGVSTPTPPAPAPEPSPPPPTPIAAVRPATNTPFALVLVLCEVLNADPTTLAPAEKNKQLAHAKWLIEQGYGEDKVRRCLVYLLSQEWRTSAIDLGTVRGEIGKWELNGQPATAEPRAAKTPRTNGHARDRPGLMDRLANVQRRIDARNGADQEAHGDIIDVQPTTRPLAGHLAPPRPDGERRGSAGAGL